MPKQLDEETLDSLIDCRARASAYRRFFGSRQEAVQFFARVQSEVHGLDRCSGTCIWCGGREDADLILRYRWSSRFHAGFGLGSPAWLLIGHVHIEEKVHKVAFDTHHAVCRSCLRRQLRRRPIAAMLHYTGLGIFFFWVLCFAAFLGVTAYLAFGFGSIPLDPFRTLLVAALLAGILGIGLAAFRHARRLRFPASLAHLCRSPFFYRTAAAMRPPTEPPPLEGRRGAVTDGGE